MQGMHNAAEYVFAATGWGGGQRKGAVYFFSIAASTRNM